MKFEFGKATEITDFAKDQFNEMYEIYKRIFITTDTNDYHILRILEGYDKDYEKCEDSYVLEWQKISKNRKDNITGMLKLKKILSEDDGSNWDCKQYDSLQECIDNVDGGFGINNLNNN